MVFRYPAITFALSLSLAVLLILPLSRVKQRADIFSAALGIMIFVCVKSIFVECGWGFAALFGVMSGFAAQLAVTLGAFVFFRELRRVCSTGGSQQSTVEIFSLLCVGIGRNLLCDYAAVSELPIYLLGEAADFALMLTAVLLSAENAEERSAAGLAGTAAAAAVMKAAGCAVLRLHAGAGVEFVGLVMLTVGVAGMVCQFAWALRQRREITAAGFAAGLTAAFCFHSLTG